MANAESGGTSAVLAAALVGPLVLDTGGNPWWLQCGSDVDDCAQMQTCGCEQEGACLAAIPICQLAMGALQLIRLQRHVGRRPRDKGGHDATSTCITTVAQRSPARSFSVSQFVGAFEASTAGVAATAISRGPDVEDAPLKAMRMRRRAPAPRRAGTVWRGAPYRWRVKARHRGTRPDEHPGASIPFKQTGAALADRVRAVGHADQWGHTSAPHRSTW
jgi:hypothetical protein